MFEGWRPPGASTAIRPSRVVGWPAPIATLVNLLKKHLTLLVRVSHAGFLKRESCGASQKGK
ncbi:hypothetical protein AUI46_04375 [archaeon 13_1_40CM_2_52_13]|nr:MAG: hypothetical protein AUI46_04375 [archaeon 13_1_40CM_2_52_13]